MFEALEAGAVPVIVADDLELPVGPKWEEFSLRVPEQDIEDVPQLVERLQDEAAEMGSAARRAWEDYFSPESTANSFVGWARHISPRLVRAKLRYTFTVGATD